jgi:glycosyltransferase involved in cell wall biosynthesis
MIKKDHNADKISILHLVHSLSVGGAEIALSHYIAALGGTDYCHYVYCFGADGPVRKRIEAFGVEVHLGKKMDLIKHPVSFSIHLYKLIMDLRYFIKEKKIQIVQSHIGHANKLAVIIGLLFKIPALPTVHSTKAFVNLRDTWDIRDYLIKAVNAFIYRMANTIVAVSSEVRDVIIKHYNLPGNKVIVVKNGIVFDNDIYKHKTTIDQDLFPGSKLKIIAVGRLVALKSFDVLIKAIAEIVVMGFNDICLIIVGDGDQYLQLEQLIYTLNLENKVKLLGIRHDVIRLMKSSDVFVISSRYEGLSIAMVEAMACSLPIIASDAPGLKDFIKVGENGLQFPVGDYKSLAKCLIKLLKDENLRHKLADGSKDCFSREYDMRKNIKPLHEFFHEYSRVARK